MKRSRWIPVAVAVVAVVATGCGAGDSGDGDDVAPVQVNEPVGPQLSADALRARLIDAGLNCGRPGPAESSDSAGLQPTEEFACVDGGSTLDAAVFAKSSALEDGTAPLEVHACTVSPAPTSILLGQNWYLDAAPSDASEDLDVLAKAADGLDVRPTSVDCAAMSTTEPADGTGSGSPAAPLASGEAHAVGGGWSVTVVGYNPSTANELVRSVSASNEVPPAGQQYVVVQVEVTYDGEGGPTTADLGFDLLAEDGDVTVGLSSSACVAPSPSWSELGRVVPGTMMGFMCTLVDTAAVPSLVLVAGPSAAPTERAYLALT